MTKGISTFFAILVVGIIAVIGFTILYSYQYIWYPEEVTTTNQFKVKSPQQTVLDFYKCYIKGREEMKGIKGALEDCNGLEKSFKEDIIAHTEGEIQFKGYDPILFAQDSPGLESVQAEQISPENGKIIVIVTFNPSWPDHKVKTYLQRLGSKWKITGMEDITEE